MKRKNWDELTSPYLIFSSLGKECDLQVAWSREYKKRHKPVWHLSWVSCLFTKPCCSRSSLQVFCLQGSSCLLWLSLIMNSVDTVGWRRLQQRSNEAYEWETYMIAIHPEGTDLLLLTSQLRLCTYMRVNWYPRSIFDLTAPWKLGIHPAIAWRGHVWTIPLWHL